MCPFETLMPFLNFSRSGHFVRPHALLLGGIFGKLITSLLRPEAVIRVHKTARLENEPNRDYKGLLQS